MRGGTVKCFTLSRFSPVSLSRCFLTAFLIDFENGDREQILKSLTVPVFSRFLRFSPFSLKDRPVLQLQFEADHSERHEYK